MNQSQFLAITCNSLEARELLRVQGAIGFGLASHWLKNWRKSFKPIAKRSNRNHVITFDSHFRTALSSVGIAFAYQRSTVIESYTEHHQNPSSYQGNSANPPFEQVAPVEYTRQEFHFPLWDAAYCGTK